MSLKLNLRTPRAYVQAVSGLFISPKNPNGLTPKEMDVLACLMEYSRHGVITHSARTKSMEKLKFKDQNFYNAMSSLKTKRAVDGEELHPVFIVKSLSVDYANNGTLG